ncbi:hypothetical protein AB0I82_33815 [Streptomyces sp. NPDC050315]|uniref:hypothetical protein n=1 Tax=Streptomyces sp. NPDC050315 TaxID=3155039 RepID=UPI00342A1CDC
MASSVLAGANHGSIDPRGRTSPTSRTPTTSPAPAESASGGRTTRSPRRQPGHDQSQRHFLYRNYSHPYLEGRSIAALDRGIPVRRGQGCTLRVTAAPAVHHQLLARCHPLDGGPGSPAVPAQRKAHREYESRVSALAPTSS